MPISEHQPQTQHVRSQPEGISVIGEAVRRLAPEAAEFVVEITTSAPNAAHALREIQAKSAQLAQALGSLGVQPNDLQPIALNVHSLYAPLLPGLPPYGNVPQIGPGGFQAHNMGASVQPDVQFGAYQARNTIRINVREPGRVGEAADAAVHTGATILGGFSFKVSDESQARRAALEAAGKDARTKAETLANATGRQLAELISITEDIVTSNGEYAALRSAVPFAFGAGAPRFIGELEYYARVSANFRLQ